MGQFSKVLLAIAISTHYHRGKAYNNLVVALVGGTTTSHIMTTL